MADIKVNTLIDKLNPLMRHAMHEAMVSCGKRKNPAVVLDHLFAELLSDARCDLARIVAHFDIDMARLSADLTRSLEQLPRGATSRAEISDELIDTLQSAWTYTSLRFGETQVRSGHLLIALHDTRHQRAMLTSMSAQFSRIKRDELCDAFAAITERSAENGLADGTANGTPPAATGANAASRTPASTALARYAVDLTAKAARGELDPVTGRDDEIRQLVDILMRRRQNNPLLTGEAGVGKTAVVEGFAQRLARGDVPPLLQGITLYALDLGLLQAGAAVKGEFEKRLREVIDEVICSPAPIVLFIDEMHMLVGAGGAAGTGDAANLLKPALARGNLRTIGATTWAEYKKYVEKDPALTRRFQVVQVSEPDEARALGMLRGVAPMLEAHHRVQLLDEAMEAAVRLSHRYIPARQLPDKAVSLIDTACARVSVSQHATPAAVEDRQRRIEALRAEAAIVERERSVGVERSARAQELSDEIAQQQAALDTLSARWNAERALVEKLLGVRAQLRAPQADAPRAPDDAASNHALTREALLAELRDCQRELSQLQGETPLVLSSVDEGAVASVVADWTGIPVGRMMRDEIDTVLRLADILDERVIGQRHALETIARRIQTSRAGLDDPCKPIGVFLLCGTSGVGKTETALALAEALYGGEQNVITVNMSEFQEAHTVSTLKGAPPGYVGYGEGGVLTEAVRRRPYSVVLLDEVEKAHPDVHELFIQVFDKGSMEDGEGRRIDFRNTVILLTSNVGSELIRHACDGHAAPPSPAEIAAALRAPLLQVFPAALLGRLVTVPYYPLSDEMLARIVRLQFGRIARRIESNHRAACLYDDAAIEHVVARCTDTDSGGRVIGALLTHTVLPRISTEFLTRLSQSEPLTRITLSARDGEFVYGFE
ncbi:type VI secretion system ATPase TssH [Caballeronia sp. BR00000012568055]|uniref:type VI secretion system ATPase TssH n=1 Tax=Caballeronia sp. BR00000012568055 TaxID=2918761 RepID=UPI0023F89DEF|nr:type VI secretion system ATPase TssH [Caballeronia sp. BR00000012568055]